MKQTVQVIGIPEPGIAEVFLERESACSGDCHKCSGCGAVRERICVRAENPIAATIGDYVVVETETRSVMKAVLLVYLVPVLLFFAGYFVGEAVQFLPGLLGAIGFLLGVVPAVLLNRHIEKKKECTFRITGFAQES